MSVMQPEKNLTWIIFPWLLAFTCSRFFFGRIRPWCFFAADTSHCHSLCLCLSFTSLSASLLLSNLFCFCRRLSVANLWPHFASEANFSESAETEGTKMILSSYHRTRFLNRKTDSQRSNAADCVDQIRRKKKSLPNQTFSNQKQMNINTEHT